MPYKQPWLFYIGRSYTMIQYDLDALNTTWNPTRMCTHLKSNTNVLMCDLTQWYHKYSTTNILDQIPLEVQHAWFSVQIEKVWYLGDSGANSLFLIPSLWNHMQTLTYMDTYSPLLYEL
jgi:hypothetical protein